MDRLDDTQFSFSEGPVPLDFVKSLSDERLSYELVEPFKEWRISFAGENLTADIRWKARFPAYYFGAGSGTSWSDHFEQSGSVAGTLKLPEGTRLLKGLDQRDKSWGARDWHIEGWYALHVQFDSFSMGLRRDVIDGVGHVSGGVSSSNGHVAIADVYLETGFMEAATRIPVRATTRVHGLDGSHYTLRSSLISPTSFVRFSRPFPDGTTELFEEMAVHECEELGDRGTGLMQWLFTHPKK